MPVTPDEAEPPQRVGALGDGAQSLNLGPVFKKKQRRERKNKRHRQKWGGLCLRSVVSVDLLCDKKEKVEPLSLNGVRADSGVGWGVEGSEVRTKFKPSDRSSLERDKSSASRQVKSGGGGVTVQTSVVVEADQWIQL